MAWRLHSEVLEFENEAHINLEKVKTYANKKRVEIKLSTEDVLVENKIHLLILSANPHNFTSVMNCSKSFV